MRRTPNQLPFTYRAKHLGRIKLALLCWVKTRRKLAGLNVFFKVFSFAVLRQETLYGLPFNSNIIQDVSQPRALLGGNSGLCVLGVRSGTSELCPSPSQQGPKAAGHRTGTRLAQVPCVALRQPPVSFPSRLPASASAPHSAVPLQGCCKHGSTWHPTFSKDFSSVRSPGRWHRGVLHCLCIQWRTSDCPSLLQLKPL